MGCELLGGCTLELLLAALPVLALQFGQVVLFLDRLPGDQPLVQPNRQLSLCETQRSPTTSKLSGPGLG